MDELNALYEEVISLDEIRGELDPQSNHQIELRLSVLKEEIRLLEREQDAIV